MIKYSEERHVFYLSLGIISIILLVIGVIYLFDFGDKAGKDNLGNIPEENKTYCTPESRLGDVCLALYKPVCGFFNSSSSTYGNNCVACHDSNVEFYTEGECLEA
jgi:hypothetical protein